jgi:hypothetical protein
MGKKVTILAIAFAVVAFKGWTTQIRLVSSLRPI